MNSSKIKTQTHSENKKRYQRLTFKGICCTGCMVFVRVELECELPVGFLQVIVTDFFVDAQHFVVVLAALYSEGRRKRK